MKSVWTGLGLELLLLGAALVRVRYLDRVTSSTCGEVAVVTMVSLPSEDPIAGAPTTRKTCPQIARVRATGRNSWQV